jgi:hypothetical protein
MRLSRTRPACAFPSPILAVPDATVKQQVPTVDAVAFGDVRRVEGEFTGRRPGRQGRRGTEPTTFAGRVNEASGDGGQVVSSNCRYGGTPVSNAARKKRGTRAAATGRNAGRQSCVGGVPRRLPKSSPERGARQGVVNSVRRVSPPRTEGG